VQIVVRPEFSPDPTASLTKTRKTAPKHSSRLSGENFGAARVQTSARHFDEWRYSSSRFCAGRSRELDSNKRSIGSSGTRFKSGINHVLWTVLVFEFSGLKNKSTSCRSVQNRRSKTGFDSLGSYISSRKQRKPRHSRVTCSVL
jgi:hypothetical protein